MKISKKSLLEVYLLFRIPVIANQYTSPGANPTISGIQTAIEAS